MNKNEPWNCDSVVQCCFIRDASKTKKMIHDCVMRKRSRSLDGHSRTGPEVQVTFAMPQAHSSEKYIDYDQPGYDHPYAIHSNTSQGEVPDVAFTRRGKRTLDLKSVLEQTNDFRQMMSSKCFATSGKCHVG